MDIYIYIYIYLIGLIMHNEWIEPEFKKISSYKPRCYRRIGRSVQRHLNGTQTCLIPGRRY